ncbi:MAG: PTS sugar transporter subunit IIA [Calditrichia bacterium]
MKLVDVLKPDYIRIPLKGDDKKSVIREVINILAPYKIFDDSEKIFDAVMEREKIMTTGVGRGVAIPHCKKESCRQFAISLGIQKDGIDFQSIDNQPAHIIFLLVGPENNPGRHIRLLSRISRLISKDNLRDDLLNCSSPQEAFDLLKKEEEHFFEILS